MATTDTLALGAGGYSFVGWPDGLPIGEQENCVVEIVRIILNELTELRKSDGGK